jgi:hypothetical protein
MDQRDPAACVLGAIARHYRADRSVRAIAKGRPFDYSTLSKVENGSTFPSKIVAGQLDDALGAKGVIRAIWPLLAELRGGSLGGKAPTREHEDSEVERRAAIQLLAALAAGTVLPPDLVETLRAGMGHPISESEAHSVDEWEQTAYEYASFLWLLPPVETIGNLAADLADLRGVVQRASDDTTRLGLQRISARLAAVMAMALHESGDFLAASRWWRTARRMADVSGDRDVQIWICGRQAMLAQSIGMADKALRLADEACHLAAGRPSAGFAEAQAARAKVLAGRDPHAARRTLDELIETFSRLPAAVLDERSAIWGWPERQLLQNRTAVLLALGDSSVCVHLTALRDRIEPHLLQGRAGVELKIGWSLINAGEVDEGLAHAVRTVEELPVVHRTTGVRRTTGRVVAALPGNARTLPAARELRALTGDGASGVQRDS